MSKFAVYFFAILTSIPAFAAIPASRMIFQRLTENAGSGSYVIEQEVEIPNGAEPLILKETWVVENDQSMRVTVTSLRDPNAIKFQIMYSSGQRWILKNGKREGSPIPNDFAERPFHLRTLDSAANYFTRLKLVPSAAFVRKAAAKKPEDNIEDFVRLGRTGGVIAWVYGSPSSGSGELSPGVWIEQDQFALRKIRFPSLAEVVAENDGEYARNLQFPRQRTVNWDNHSVSIRLLSINSKAPALSMSSLDVPWKITGLDDQPAEELIREFYTRFR